jgi:outer membrane protein TolC
MRGLKDWSKHLKTYHNLFLASILVSSSLFAGESKELLSQTKKDILNYSYEKSIEDSDKLKKDWINPFSYKYIYNDGETYTTKKSMISISQPIFKSGGIYFAIKYANSVGKYSTTSIDVQEKELIKQTVSLLFQIKKIDISIKKQKLLVTNAKLDITRKKEQVLNGILDTSFLDNAIIDANTQQNNLIDLEYEKESLVNNLAQVSDKKYEEVELPTLSLVDKENFLENNIYIKQAKEDANSAYWLKNATISNYLPTINLTADYTKYHDTDNNPALSEDGTKNIGFNITIPFDIRFNNTIQSAKLEYLQKKATIKDQKKEEKALFKNSMAKLKSLDKKIDIAKSDVALYDSLLTQLEEQLTVGMTTLSDVETMKNSKVIKKLEVQSLNIDKQLELLEVYSRLENG